MDHATCFRRLSATHFATSLLPLTVRLIPVLTAIGRLIVGFRRAVLTPQVCRQFETQLLAQLRELGRIIVDWTFNHIEPRDRRDMPNPMCFQGVWYRRRSKTANRTVATLFGTITLWRYLYQPLHGVEPSIFPLEIRLGLEVGLATPALTERVGQAAVTSSQKSVLEYLQRNHGVSWSVATLRKVIAGLSEGMEPHRHDASVAQVLKWLEQAHASRGGRKPVLAVGRDGLMLPIRGADVLSGGSDGDRLGPRSEGTAIGDGVPGPDARARARNVVAAVDGRDRGRVATMERALAAVGLHHGRGKPSDPVLPPGSQADATSTTPR